MKPTYRTLDQQILKTIYLGGSLLRSSLFFLESQPVILQQSLLRRIRKTETPTREQQRLAMKETFKLLSEDAELLAKIQFPMEKLIRLQPIEHAKTYLNILKDGLSVVWRKYNKNHKDFSEEAAENLSDLPEYYQRNFHFQTDGYLSEHSADLYEHQVEILFAGAANAMRRLLFEPVLEFAHSDGKSLTLKFLEFGAGTGAATRQVATLLPEVLITAQDLSPAYVEKAKENLKDLSNVEFVRGAAEDIPYKDGEFDLVYSVFMFHELPKEIREKIIAQAFRVLKPGGRFVIVDSIQVGDNPELDWATEIFPKDFHEPFYKNYVLHPLKEMFEEAGFTSVTTKLGFVSKAIWGDKPHASKKNPSKSGASSKPKRAKKS